MVCIIGQIKISISDHLRSSSISAFQWDLARSYQVHRKYRFLLAKLAPEAIPLELGFHLELFVENASLSLWCYRLNLGINFLLTSFP